MLAPGDAESHGCTIWRHNYFAIIRSSAHLQDVVTVGLFFSFCHSLGILQPSADVFFGIGEGSLECPGEAVAFGVNGEVLCCLRKRGELPPFERNLRHFGTSLGAGVVPAVGGKTEDHDNGYEGHDQH